MLYYVPFSGYAAPEVVMNLRKVISRKTDVYSLGVIIIKLMTGAENQSSSETVRDCYIFISPFICSQFII